MPNVLLQFDIGNVFVIVCLFVLSVKYHMASRKSEKIYKKAIKRTRRNLIMQHVRTALGA